MLPKQAESSTIAEYLAYEYASEHKHEYEGGQVSAMSGGSINHGLPCGNVYAALRRKLAEANRSRQVINSEVRVHIKAADAIVYPDCMVVCDGLETSEDDPDAITNPLVIVEVLSKSTADYDRGDKFFKYRQLPSLRAYILINQERPVVETFSKRQDNVWEIGRYAGLEQNFYSKVLDVTVAMSELYADVRW